MANYGFVYVLLNKSMRNIYKIGYTDRSPMQRASELSNSTGVPLPFEVAFYIEIDDPRDAESDFHQLYSEYRLSSNREFFRFTPRQLCDDVMVNFTENGINFVKTDAIVDILWELHQEELDIKAAAKYNLDYQS